ncbi:mitochondrial 54S ribosomal protein uL10m [Lipomyces oligophaga]|uniref:mitochondrial 54S ribosomal protein uL10m n=1 Tax=Lipomyces oligophaga TaxID=45792 RepID=UPI0034CD1EEC
MLFSVSRTVCSLRSVVRWSVTIRRYVPATAGQSTALPIHLSMLPERNTVKALNSRKVYLVDRYTHMLRTHPVLLVVQHNNLTTQESFLLRAQLVKNDARLTVIRNNLMKVTLRGLTSPDPASWEAREKHKFEHHPLSVLLKGPTAFILLNELDTEKLKAVIDILEKSAGKLMMMGAQIEGSLMSRDEVDRVKNLGSLPQLRAELAGVLEVLRGAGLVSTLSSTSSRLYLTLDGLKKQQEAEESSGEA